MEADTHSSVVKRRVILPSIAIHAQTPDGDDDDDDDVDISRHFFIGLTLYLADCPTQLTFIFTVLYFSIVF